MTIRKYANRGSLSNFVKLYGNPMLKHLLTTPNQMVL